MKVSKLLSLGLLVFAILAFGELSTLCELWNAGLRDLEVLRLRNFENTSIGHSVFESNFELSIIDLKYSDALILKKLALCNGKYTKSSGVFCLVTASSIID